MALSKKSIFPETEQDIARMAKALSHPARVAILNELTRRNICICGEIVEVLPLSQATVSQHLKELKQAGIIRGTVDGTKSCYCIDWEIFSKYREAMMNFLQDKIHQDNREECC